MERCSDEIDSEQRSCACPALPCPASFPHLSRPLSLTTQVCLPPSIRCSSLSLHWYSEARRAKKMTTHLNNRLRWTKELHKKFMDAHQTIEQQGEKPTPMRILRIMKVKCVTLSFPEGGG